jgi:hypothetical protein
MRSTCGPAVLAASLSPGRGQESAGGTVWPVANPDELNVPTPKAEADFWALIEAAWARLGPEVRAARQELVVRPAGSPADTSAVKSARRAFLDVLAGSCRGMTSAELIDLDRVCERKLWEIDRADVHAVTQGSDDGFLYARGFIVAIGREFYDSVAADPRMGVPYAEWEEMCYFFAHLHHKRFGGFPDTCSGISRESGQNLLGWLG